MNTAIGVYAILDYKDRELKVGTTVRADEIALPDAEGFGVVIDLGEWDGDNDDEGRPIGVPPRVEVLWPDGVTERYVTSDWEWSGWAWEREPVQGRVEEIEVVEGPLRAPPVWRKQGRMTAFEYAGTAYIGGQPVTVERQKFDIVEFWPYEPSAYVHSPTWSVIDEGRNEVFIDAYDLDDYQGIKEPDYGPEDE